MASWVHCNNCFEQLQKNKNVSFFLTECGHITCEKCVEHMRTPPTCMICRKSTSLIKLSKDMNPSLRCFFNPLDIQLKKCIEIYNFQNNHRESILANYIKKYEYAKQQCMKQYTINNKLLQEKKMLRSIIRNSSDRDKPMSSTPIRKNVQFQNTSISTITPEKPFKISTSTDNRSYPSFFTPMKTVPGFAQRLSASKMNNQSISSMTPGISPLQVVPMAGRMKPSVAVHRFPLGPMSSLQELQMKNKFNKI
ncbi:RING finger protein narya-like [Coccinella septempunctata]|uniref:RING finger protein narya-like n=1 Tax=Coccinella septempunctata TaxID=41139 RepID=UPI001D062DA8|nr:RING finger protein narya-like [Coccinella septempunctata]